VKRNVQDDRTCTVCGKRGRMVRHEREDGSVGRDWQCLGKGCVEPRLGERVAIVGSRDFPNLESVGQYVSDLPRDSVIVSGGARGVDRAAEAVARAKGMATLIFPADWNRHGKAAGYMRNRLIVANADRLVAFQHNNSRGTQHSIDLARERGIDVEVRNA
jgi:predicted Rossmann fold nucleotide-binding protein DprA/Smf involved in DNA uptake